MIIRLSMYVSRYPSTLSGFVKHTLTVLTEALRERHCLSIVFVCKKVNLGCTKSLEWFT